MAQVDRDDLNALFAGLDRAVKEAVDMTRVEKELGEHFHEAEREQFDTRGSRGGTPWQGLTEAYAARKARTAPGQQVMRESDRLYQSLTDDTPDSIREVSQDSITFGTTVPYAGTQNDERALMSLTDGDVDAYADTIMDDAEAHLRSLGFDTFEP